MVYTRWSRWAREGVWAAILDFLAEDAAEELRHLGSSHIKVHQDASKPSVGQENQALGRTQGRLNSKVTARWMDPGRVVQLALAPDQRNDTIAAQDIIFPARKKVVADKGYESDAFRERIRAAGSEPCIPPWAGRRAPARFHQGFYRKRHRVENFFQRIKRRRPIGTRYEKLDITFFAFLTLVAFLDRLKPF